MIVKCHLRALVGNPGGSAGLGGGDHLIIGGGDPLIMGGGDPLNPGGGDALGPGGPGEAPGGLTPRCGGGEAGLKCRGGGLKLGGRWRGVILISPWVGLGDLAST